MKPTPNADSLSAINAPVVKGGAFSRLGRAGYFFVATSEEVTAMDLLAGPKQPIKLSESCTAPAPVSANAIADLHEPPFLDLVVSAVLHGRERLQVVRQTGQVVLYRFPTAVTSALAELTPQRPAFCMATIAAIADELMMLKEVSEKYKWGGVQGAVLSIRGHALKAVPRNDDKELYYWFWREG